MSPARLPDALANPLELESFARVELIVFDLDGTLIGQPGNIPGEKLSGLLGRLSHQKTAVTLATGRTFTGAARVVGSIEALRKLPLVLYNGSVVMQSPAATIISCIEIDQEAVVTVVTEAARLGAEALVYCLDRESGLAIRPKDAEAVYFVGEGQAPNVEFNGMPVQLGWNRTSRGTPVAILVSAPSLDTLQKLRPRLNNIKSISVTQSGSKYLEIRPAGSTKAVGIASLAAHAGILPEHVLAVGDNDNDVELLKWAGVSVCVANASPAAKSASRFIANYGAEQAAIEVLDLVRRAQRLFRGGKRSGETRKYNARLA